jgi:hypothetical protein
MEIGVFVLKLNFRISGQFPSSNTHQSLPIWLGRGWSGLRAAVVRTYYSTYAAYADSIGIGAELCESTSLRYKDKPHMIILLLQGTEAD